MGQSWRSLVGKIGSAQREKACSREAVGVVQRVWNVQPRNVRQTGYCSHAKVIHATGMCTLAYAHRTVTDRQTDRHGTRVSKVLWRRAPQELMPLWCNEVVTWALGFSLPLLPHISFLHAQSNTGCKWTKRRKQKVSERTCASACMSPPTGGLSELYLISGTKKPL